MSTLPRPTARTVKNLIPRSTIRPASDVMAGPAHTFVPNAPQTNTPQSLLRRPGLGFGTRMG